MHHLTYARIFNEPMKDLMVLCRVHHNAIESAIAGGKMTRDAAVKHLRRKTKKALIFKSKPAPEYRDALLRNQTFLHIFRSSETRGKFKRALRKGFKEDAFFHRLMANALILWRDRRDLRTETQPVAA